MTRNHYILKGKKLKKVSLLEWALWFEIGEHRIVKQENVGKKHRVSTVFLGIDHNFSNQGPELLFETMVFAEGEPENNDTYRYSTYEQAERGHEKVVKSLKKL